MYLKFAHRIYVESEVHKCEEDIFIYSRAKT